MNIACGDDKKETSAVEKKTTEDGGVSQDKDDNTPSHNIDDSIRSHVDDYEQPSQTNDTDQYEDPLTFEGLFNKVIADDGNTFIAMKKSLLGIELLWSPNIYTPADIYMSEPYSLGAKIVWFTRDGDELVMHESLEGRLLSDSLPAEEYIARIPIVFENDTAFALDFNSGIKTLFWDMPWGYATDFMCYEGGEMGCWDWPRNFVFARIIDSTIDEVKVSPDRVYISEYAKTRMPWWEDYDPTFIIHYTLKPYTNNQNYQVKETNYQRHIGYFENYPVYQSNYSADNYKINITKWDIAKPVVYTISANTPAKYVDAIKEGILYWNKAFGKEVVTVEVATDPNIRSGDPDHNVVQWIDYSTWYAYADAQTDPRTGEILNAGVFLPNWSEWIHRDADSFSPSGSVAEPIKHFLDTVRDIYFNDSDNKPKNIPDSFVGGRLCQYDIRNSFFNRDFRNKQSNHHAQNLPLAHHPDLKNASAADVQAYYDRVLNDYYRILTAHEVGHTLGLRHNFAGSLSNNLDHNEYFTTAEKYLSEGIVSSKDIPSSSVMDYHSFVTDVYAGRIIKDRVLPYDEDAIQWGYFNKTIEELDPPLFCSDMFTNYYYDCWVWDDTANPTLAVQNATDILVKRNLPLYLAYQFIEAKAPFYSAFAKPVEQVILYPEWDQWWYLGYYYETDMGIFIDPTTSSRWRYLTVEKNYPNEVNTDFLSFSNKAAIDAETDALILNTIDQIGGLSNLVYRFLQIHPDNHRLPKDFQTTQDNFAALVNSPWFKTGKTHYGKSYSFSDEEIDVVLGKAKEYFDSLSKYYYSAAVQSFTYPWNGFSYSDEWYSYSYGSYYDYWLKYDPFASISDLVLIEEIVRDTVSSIITEPSDTTLDYTVGTTTITISLTQPFYDIPINYEYTNIRLNAVSLLNIMYGFDPKWSKGDKVNLRKTLLPQFEEAKRQLMIAANQVAETSTITIVVETSTTANKEGEIHTSLLQILPYKLKKWFSNEAELLSALKVCEWNDDEIAQWIITCEGEQPMCEEEDPELCLPPPEPNKICEDVPEECVADIDEYREKHPELKN